MTRPRTLSELAKSVQLEIDAEYSDLSRRLINAYFAPPPEGWTPPKPTRRQRATAFAWRLRGWLAVPFVWVLRWLYPSALDRGDQ